MRIPRMVARWSVYFLGCFVCVPPGFAAPELAYGVTFHAHFVPADRMVEARIEVDQREGELRALDLAAPAGRFSGFTGDGEIDRDGARVVWRVPRDGGVLRYRVVVDHCRKGAYDSRLTDSWAIFRLGDLFPPARVRSRKGAQSESALVLDGPNDWSFESRYGSASKTRAVVDPDRRFDRPTGWAAAGELGIRRDRIAGRRIAVAAPVTEKMTEKFRRLDTLTFLRWTLPRFVEVFPDFPARLLIVGASDGMWRGGLSGPGSLYLHADRPLVSENSTSALLHELVHIATSAASIDKDDWIVEGLAEYYSLEILRRAGGISQRRFDKAIHGLAEWAETGNGGLAQPSTGADTAWAVLKLHALADELYRSGSSLDAIVGEMTSRRAFNGGELNRQVERALGRASVILSGVAEAE